MATKKSTAKTSSEKTVSAKKNTGKTTSAKKKSTKKKSAKRSRTKPSSSKKRAVRRAPAITAAVAAGGAVAQPATCMMKTRGDVSRLVLAFIRSLGFPSAVEASDFTSDIVVSPNARRGWATPLRNAVSAQGCNAGTFGPDDCGNAGKASDIVDALAGAIGV